MLGANKVSMRQNIPELKKEEENQRKLLEKLENIFTLNGFISFDRVQRFLIHITNDTQEDKI